MDVAVRTSAASDWKIRMVRCAVIGLAVLGRLDVEENARKRKIREEILNKFIYGEFLVGPVIKGINDKNWAQEHLQR